GPRTTSPARLRRRSTPTEVWPGSPEASSGPASRRSQVGSTVRERTTPGRRRDWIQARQSRAERSGNGGCVPVCALWRGALRRMDNQLFAYSPITDRSPIRWPGGARVAFYLGLNIEHYQVDKPSTSIFGGTAGLAPDPLTYRRR